MFEVYTERTAPPLPRAAVVLYDGFATRHRIVMTEAGPVLGEATRIADKILREAIAALDPARRRTRGWSIPPQRLVAHTEGGVAWWVPGSVRPIWIAARGRHRERVGEAPWPALVFIAKDRTLRVAALADNDVPASDSVLLHAPLFNVDEQGTVCLGTLSAPARCDLDSIAHWEQEFRDAWFTHVNTPRVAASKAGHCPRTLPGAERTLRALWRELLRRRPTAFPTERLLPMEMTLATFLERT